jgi:hypothetical protein
VVWEMARQDGPDVAPLAHRILAAISARSQQRVQLNAARERAAARPPGDVSATGPDDPTRKEAPQWTTGS